MPTIRLNPAIRFFAAPAEIGSWVEEWRQRYDLQFLFARRVTHKGTAHIEFLNSDSRSELDNVVASISRFELLYLSTVELASDVASINQIARANPDQLCVTLPALCARGFGSASLGSVSKVAASLRVYRAIAGDLLARTEEGVWFRKESRKKLTQEPCTRFSRGALQLMELGVPLSGGGDTVVGKLQALKA